MIKKNILRTFLLLFFFQLSVGAMAHGEAKTFVDQFADARVNIDSDGKIAAQKKYDNRKLLIIAGGVAVVSFAVGAAAVALYCNDKVDTLIKELNNVNVTSGNVINLDEDQSHRVKIAQQRKEQLLNEIEELKEKGVSDFISNQIRCKKLEIDSCDLDLKVAFDIEKYKVNKKMAERDKKIKELQGNKWGCPPEAEKLKIQNERDKLSLNKYWYTLQCLDEQYWQNALKEQEDQLDECEKQLEDGITSDSDDVDYSSDEDSSF